MKTEAEKIAEFCPIGCYCCDKADFNGKSIICSIEGTMTPDKRKPHNRIMGATMGKFPEILKEFERPSGGE